MVEVGGDGILVNGNSGNSDNDSGSGGTNVWRTEDGGNDNGDSNQSNNTKIKYLVKKKNT